MGYIKPLLFNIAINLLNEGWRTGSSIRKSVHILHNFFCKRVVAVEPARLHIIYTSIFDADILVKISILENGWSKLIFTSSVLLHCTTSVLLKSSIFLVPDVNETKNL